VLLPPLGLPALAEGLLAAAFAVLPFGQYLVAARLDVGFLFVFAVAALATAALLREASMAPGLRAALHVAWQHTPAAVALAGVVVVTGSLRVLEIERSQGGLPWEWLAFRSPASLLSFAIFVAAVRVASAAPGRPAEGWLARVDGCSRVAGPMRGTWEAGACRAHRLVLCGLVAALFLGGWSLPGVSPAQQDGRPLLEVAGAFVFWLKVGTLLAAAGAAEQVLPGGPLGVASRRRTPWQLALSLAAAAAAAGWSSWEPAHAVQPLMSPALVLLTAAALAALALRLRHGLRSPVADGHVSPFL
jgi:NADH-quinone oxidoreductase subunit H